MFGLDFFQFVFMFFFFSFSGWLGEVIMESTVRKRLVNKGFFKGPYVPVHGFGAFLVYAACMPLKRYPPLVFLASTLICTAVEYFAGVFLEKVFSIRGWDYETYPFTKWCHYKRRIALTTSLFFGVVATCIIYFYWDFGIFLMNLPSANLLIIIDIALCTIFFIDIIFSARRRIKNKLTGIPNITIGLEKSYDEKTDIEFDQGSSKV